MIDILMEVYNILKSDDDLMRLIDKKNIKFNQYPDVKDKMAPYIVIDDYDDPIPEWHSDGDRIAYNYAFQIDVMVKASDAYNARKRRNEISNRISELLWKNQMKQIRNLGNEYDKNLALYRSTRRYEAIFYENY
ncbi:hypothetical protein MPU07_000048 [Staphylococcus pseudintermedius]|uniref:ORF024 n=3 Tax=root TaxID=1 RepID=Q4ZD70_BP263|nr:hypothetical protein [Staphylococcus pseudintermedius]YP_009823305.1 tail completion protein [Staphylococcus phage vB_SpsS_QT1]YP_239806.1 ORF024 [Staphylococcus phage 2638A]AZB66732.1 hypothetical protein [Staphylococcus phage phiSP119-1]AAX91010.1 ORF024 [Staphylococcus phage 2638A]EGQ0290632.1 hypothetical protein [Staphylococcus pseudintermedius]EGQ0300020.1 hypothetical protein [Staphylococcus pseudintermedius]EGQ0364171.1 hypothetical protein [Staphylococcus pseudintermedius]